MGNTAQQCRSGLFQDSDFAGDLEGSKIHIRRSFVHVWKSNICTDQLDAQEANVGISQVHRIRDHIVSRRLKHLEVKHLWFQELVAKKLLTVKWVPRQENAADDLTHSTSRMLGVSFLDKTSIDSLSENVQAGLGKPWTSTQKRR